LNEHYLLKKSLVQCFQKFPHIQVFQEAADAGDDNDGDIDDQKFKGDSAL
jgi:hypothetical protein